MCVVDGVANGACAYGASTPSNGIHAPGTSARSACAPSCTAAEASAPRGEINILFDTVGIVHARNLNYLHVYLYCIFKF